MNSRCCANFIFCVILTVASAKENVNSTKDIDSSARYFSENSENRLPLSKKYRDESHKSYPQFSDKYNKGNFLPYEVPSGFDQFVPDKSSDAKYEPVGYYLPYTKLPPGHAVAEFAAGGGDRVTNSLSSYSKTGSKIKDFALKAMKLVTGTNNDHHSIDMEVTPSLLSTLKNFIKDPLVALIAIVVPLSFILVTVIPFISKMLMKMAIGPAVTSVIAGTVARGLKNPAIEQVIVAASEFGAKAIQDPRCFQRLVCETAKVHIESRSGRVWGAQKMVQKLTKTVDEKLWNALGLKGIFDALQSGKCGDLECSDGRIYSFGKTLLNKLPSLLTKLFNYTEVVQ